MAMITALQLNNLVKAVSNGYHAAFLVVGTSRFFLIADFVFIYDLIIGPFFGGKRPKTPSKEITAIALLVAFTALWSGSPNDGVQTGIRIFVLAMILPTYKYGFHFKQVLGVSLGMLALFAVFQSSIMPRALGIHVNASMLGQTALVFMPIYWLELGLFGAVILTVSISRSAMVTFVVFAIVSRRSYFQYLAAFTTALFIVFATISTPVRVSTGGIIDAVENRVETVTGFSPKYVEQIYDDKCGGYRPIHWSWHGYGFGGFCDGTGQPRPHNIFVLSFYELGIFVVPFWGLIIYAGRRLSFIQIVPLIALGMVTEELLGRPEGIYLIASWLIATTLMKRAKNIATITV